MPGLWPISSLCPLLGLMSPQTAMLSTDGDFVKTKGTKEDILTLPGIITNMKIYFMWFHESFHVLPFWKKYNAHIQCNVMRMTAQSRDYAELAKVPCANLGSLQICFKACLCLLYSEMFCKRDALAHRSWSQPLWQNNYQALCRQAWPMWGSKGPGGGGIPGWGG